MGNKHLNKRYMPKKYIQKKVKSNVIENIPITKANPTENLIQSPLEKTRRPEKKPDTDKFFV